MNVKDLKELLEEYGDDVEVLLSIDAEGNVFAKLDDKYGILEGEIVDATYAPNVEINAENPGKIDCIVLFPTGK